MKAQGQELSISQNSKHNYLLSVCLLPKKIDRHMYPIFSPTCCCRKNPNHVGNYKCSTF